MKLSAEQITQIKSWISKRGFTHTDVQYEILDHVASAIEDKMEEKPELDLEEAFEEVHKSFGVLGFSTIEDAISSRVQKEVFNAYLNAGKKILTSYRVFLPLLIIFSLISVYQQLPEYFEMTTLILFSTFVLTAVIFIIKLYVQKNEIRKYRSFQIAISFALIITVNILSIQTNLITNLHPNYKMVAYSFLIIIVYSIFLGTRQMIRKTKKLHHLYQ
ncbi:hypothetical protein [Marivirga sp.]|uniref:hypothetical protein n=1 Tax=Marivirga sp. TaxID=2018662 RepID=UPI002D7F6349|nr:hypothetical protein [Marivirga sp.]HET8859078.1 hypothetical protein [Marivirga sp.]